MTGAEESDARLWQTIVTIGKAAIILTTVVVGLTIVAHLLYQGVMGLV